MTRRFLWMQGSSVFAGQLHDEAQHVPEHQGHRGEQVQGGAGGAVGGVVADDVGGVVEDAAGSEQDHQGREPDAQGEAQDDAGDDGAQGDQAAGPEHAAQEGEVLGAAHGRPGQAAHQQGGGEHGGGDGAGHGHAGQGEHGREDAGFGDHVDAQGGELGHVAFRLVRHGSGQPAHHHEAPQDGQPGELGGGDELQHDHTEACQLQDEGEQRKGHDGAAQVQIGGLDELGAADFAPLGVD